MYDLLFDLRTFILFLIAFVMLISFYSFRLHYANTVSLLVHFHMLMKISLHSLYSRNNFIEYVLVFHFLFTREIYFYFPLKQKKKIESTVGIPHM